MRRDHALHDGLRMPTWMVRAVNAVGALVLGSGLLWLGFHHLVSVEGEFGPVAHPLERWSLVLHGGGALLAAWMLGVIWLGHVRRGIALGSRNLATGWTLLILLLFLFASGWGLYYLGDADWRGWTATAHWIVGLLSAAILWLHSRPPPRG
jgi:hypothetical protein